MNLTLNSKVALITGGSRGIGAAAVRLFSSAGAKVVFNFRKARSEAESLVKECGPANTLAVCCDLHGTGTARELVDAAVRQFGRLDILVANHGIWPSEDVSIDDMSEQQWASTIDVNLNSVFALIKHSVAQ